MFQGETSITVDDKGRLAIPAAYRDVVARECGNKLVLTYNPFEQGCLLLYPPQAWEQLRDKVMALPNAQAANRIVQRQLVSSAAFLELDGNGRVGIPASQRNAIGIEKKAVLLGADNKFELWNEQVYRAVMQKTLSDADLGGDLLELKL